MPLGTLDRTPPPFFRQGASALSKLILFSALALFLMVADTRFRLTQPMRIALAAVVYPVQWLVMRPILLLDEISSYFESLKVSQSTAEAARQKLGLQSQRANQVEQLTLENTRLRQVLQLRERITTPSQAAQVLYDSADAYSRKVVIDKGLLQGVSAGSPVLDERGVLGQVTRVYPSVSEVTLVTDREQAIPVLNVRTGARAVAFGDPGAHSNALELRFMASNADVKVGDVLTTSGVDGVYPPGLPVARVDKIERRVETAFAHIFCTPLAGVDGALHVMVLQPVSGQIPARPVPDVVQKGAKKGAAP
jgi:rod shape-determining protein MreC